MFYLVTKDRPRDCSSGITDARYRDLVRSWVHCSSEQATFVVYSGFLLRRRKPFLRSPKKDGTPIIAVGEEWLRAAGIPVEALVGGM